MDYKQFNTLYSNKTYSVEYKSRSEFLEYFKNTHPEEYRKYRDTLNKQRRDYYAKIKEENGEKYKIYRQKQCELCKRNYIRNREYYRQYYKNYINNPINRQRNRLRSREWVKNNPERHRENVKRSINKKNRIWKNENLKKEKPISVEDNPKRAAIHPALRFVMMPAIS